MKNLDNSTKHVPHVAIVLLSYNSLKLVKNFLPKIISTTANYRDKEIVVVDNASTDDTNVYLAEHFPDIRVVTLKVNKGFTNGYVESLSQIKATNYVLISSDIEVTDGWLEPAIKLLDSSDEIAVVQPKIMSFDRRNEFEYAGAAGGYIDHLGFPFCRGRIVNEAEEDHGQYDDVREIFWASGACFFIKAELFHKAGGFDNDFFAHMEEIDLCWRLRGMGYKIMFQPASKIFHMGGFIIQYGSPAKVYRNHRNNLIMLLKNLPSSELWWKIPFRFTLDYLAFIKMAFDGNLKASMAVVKAHTEFIFLFKKWYKKRKETQASKTVKRVFGIYPGSIVWNFFILKKNRFPDFKWDPVKKQY